MDSPSQQPAALPPTAAAAPALNPIVHAVALERLRGRLESARSALAAIEDEEAVLLRQTPVTCLGSFSSGRGCGALFEVGQLTYLQSWHYVRPSGCSDGDYHVPDEGAFDCPGCGRRNRLYNRPTVDALRSSFKAVADIRG